MKHVILASIKGEEVTFIVTAKNCAQALTTAKSQLRNRQIDGDFIEGATLSLVKKNGAYHYDAA